MAEKVALSHPTGMACVNTPIKQTELRFNCVCLFGFFFLDVGLDEKSSAVMHPLPENDRKKLESAGVTAEVEPSEDKGGKKSFDVVDPFSLDIVNKLVHFKPIKTWTIVSHYLALSTSTFIDPATKDNVDEDVEPDSMWFFAVTYLDLENFRVESFPWNCHS